MNAYILLVPIKSDIILCMLTHTQSCMVQAVLHTSSAVVSWLQMSTSSKVGRGRVTSSI